MLRPPPKMLRPLLRLQPQKSLGFTYIVAMLRLPARITLSSYSHFLRFNDLTIQRINVFGMSWLASRFVTANVTGQIAKITRQIRSCHGVTGKNPRKEVGRGVLTAP